MKVPGNPFVAAPATIGVYLKHSRIVRNYHAVPSKSLTTGTCHQYNPPDFVRTTAEHFSIGEVSADKAYSSKQNLHAIVDAGGTPYIPFKPNTKTTPKHKKGHDSLWNQMYHLFSLNEAEFNRHYHKRSNVETTFMMIKAKFGERTRAKTDTAQVN